VTRVVIAGGGVAGLSIGFELTKAADAVSNVLVFERSPRPGGNLRSEQIDGYLCERGPNGFLDNVPETLALVGELGLEHDLLPSNTRARRRYIYRHGRLHEVPGGPMGLATSGLLSIRGRLRVMSEPFAAARPEGDETIHAFAARRIGREAADVLIDSMVSGVFGGNARKLSLRACFPKMWDMETEHGSLVKAMLARGRARRSRSGSPMGAPGGHLTSFTHGIEQLVQALASALGARLQNACGIRRVHPRTPGLAQGWIAELDDGRLVDADAVVLTGSAGSSAAQVESFDAKLAGVLREIPAVPLAVVCLGYETNRLDRPLDGFGFLVPRGEGITSLGALWDSSIYPNRAPANRSLVRVMTGGAHDPGAVELSDGALIERACNDLRATMRVGINPVFTHVFRHPVGIPQYTVGHLDRLARIDNRLARHPGLFVAGNSYHGVSINSCVAQAGPIADAVRLAIASPALHAQARG